MKKAQISTVGKLVLTLLVLALISFVIYKFILQPATSFAQEHEKCYGTKNFIDFEYPVNNFLIKDQEGEAYKYYKTFRICQDEEEVFEDLEILPLPGLNITETKKIKDGLKKLEEQYQKEIK